MKSHTKMDKEIKADLYRYGGLTGTKGFIRGLSYPGFRYTYFIKKSVKESKTHDKKASSNHAFAKIWI